jgi:mono/diheme cytochrome c family protein
MSLWNLLYLKDARFQAVPAQTAEWNRGAYLVQGLGHCSACHTPRSFTGGEKASSEADGDAFLAGSTIDGWYAQPLRQLEGVAPPGLGTWSRPELVDYLKTGRNARTAAFGAMVEVVGNSTQYLSHEDLAAIAVYLKSLGNGAQEGSAAASVPVYTSASAPAPLSSAAWTPASAPAPVARAVDSSDPTALALRAGDAAFLAAQPGAMVYLNNCAACHRSDGQGARSTFPSLAGSSSVAATDPTSLIRIILQGSAMPHTTEAPSELGMPALDWRLGDDQVADVLSFVRRSWGNHAEPVTAKAVGNVRAALPASPVQPAEKQSQISKTKP